MDEFPMEDLEVFQDPDAVMIGDAERQDIIQANNYSSSPEPTSRIKNSLVSPLPQHPSRKYGKDIRDFFMASHPFDISFEEEKSCPPTLIVILNRAMRFGGQLQGIHYVSPTDSKWMATMEFLQSSNLEFMVVRNITKARKALGNMNANINRQSTLVRPNRPPETEEEESNGQVSTSSLKDEILENDSARDLPAS